MRHGAALLALVLLGSSPSWAQSRTEAEEPKTEAGPPRVPTKPLSPAEQARQLGRAGLLAYGTADFEAAIDYFARAEDAMHSPVFQLYRARALLALGRSGEGRLLLMSIVEERLTDQAPEAWRRAQEDATRELAAAVSTPDGDEEPPDSSLPPDFDADGHVERSVSGQERSGPTAPPRPTGFWLQRTPNERGALVAWGAGATAAVLAAVTGAVAWAEAGAVKSNCAGTTCRPEDLPRAEHARTLANLATVGAGVAVVGGVTGLALWLAPTASRQSKPGPAASVSGIMIAGLGLRVTGHF